MSGISVDHSRFRFFSQGPSRLAKLMRKFASKGEQWTAGAARFMRGNSRRNETEFPSATQPAFELLQRALRSAHARNCAPRGALRPHNNRQLDEVQHGNSFIGKRRSPETAGRLWQERRFSPAQRPQHDEKCGGETKAIVLAKSRRIFRKRKIGTGSETSGAQWCVATAAIAAAGTRAAAIA